MMLKNKLYPLLVNRPMNSYKRNSLSGGELKRRGLLSTKPAGISIRQRDEWNRGVKISKTSRLNKTSPQLSTNKQLKKVIFQKIKNHTVPILLDKFKKIAQISNVNCNVYLND